MTDQVELILKDWVGTGEAVRIAGRTEPWLRKLRNAGRLAFVRAGGRILWKRADLEALGPKSRRGRPRGKQEKSPESMADNGEEDNQ